MDKRKTGILIKEARTKKNYTQSELGDLLGVTNKAVSRWENGESFPDVGVLENLSSILDIRIQDIVTGETESDNEEVITELVRFSKLQQLEKNRKFLGYIFAFLTLFCCCIAGFACFGSLAMLCANDSGAVYIILMTITMLLSVYGCVSQDKGAFQPDRKHGRHMCYISIISVVWCVLVTWIFMLLISNGIMPFGMKLTSVGPFIDWQLIVIFIINIGILFVELYRNVKRSADIHWGYIVSVSAVYLTVLYGDMLHRLTAVDEFYQILTVRTLVVLAELIVSLLLVNCLERKKYSGADKE